jgi:hypothetical protein
LTTPGTVHEADEAVLTWSPPPSSYGPPGEFAYRAVTSEGLDEIAEDPAGQLRFLLNASDVMGGIRGTAVEKSDLSVQVTPRETAGLIRQRHSAC